MHVEPLSDGHVAFPTRHKIRLVYLVLLLCLVVCAAMCLNLV
jgi:hypothetical protein